MENGSDMIDEPNIGETKSVENAVSHSEEGHEDLHGVPQLKDSEGDDVFEEAVDARPEEIHIQEEQPGEPDSSDTIVNGDENVEQTRDLNRSSNGGHDAKKFEEVMNVDMGINADDVKVVDSEVAEPTDELWIADEAVDGDDDVKEVLPNESNEVANDGVISNRVADLEEVANVITNVETSPVAAIEAKHKGHGIFEKSQSGVLDETPLVHDKLGNGDVKKVDSNEIELSKGNETNLYQEYPSAELKDAPSELKASSVSLNLSADEDIETTQIKFPLLEEDSTTETPSFHKYLGSKDADEIELVLGSETDLHQDDSIEQSKDDSVYLGQKQAQFKCAELEQSSTDLGISLDEKKEKEERKPQPSEEYNKLGDGDVKVELDVSHLSQEKRTDLLPDDKYIKTKDSSADPETEKQLSEGEESRDSSADLGTSSSEATEITETKAAPAVEDSTTEISEKNKVNVTESEVKEFTYSNPQCDGEELEIQYRGENNKSVGNVEPEILPVATVDSSNRTRMNPASQLPPAGLGAAAPLLEPAPRAVQQPRVNGGVHQREAQLVEDPMNGEAEENDETREKLQMIRVKFLRLAHRLGQTPHNVVVAQVLYRLGLAEQLRGRNTGRAGAFSFERASSMAVQLEASGQEPLDFSCTIMVLGKTGVGKSATINSIFDETKFKTDAFQMGTKKVQDVVGTVQGIKVRVIDTPGLLPSWSDQPQNEKILNSVKKFIKKNPPDIVLYLDRLDMQSRDMGDMPLLRTITGIFGPSIWFNAIVVLTHAASAPPDGPNGTASSYEMFVTQRSHVVQQAIRQAAGDMRLMNPVSLVENHSACRTNRAGQRVLPNGQVWKPHLLLLSFASKILAEANTLLKLQDSPPGKPFANRSRVPPLPFLLSSLLQPRPQLKLPEEQFGDEDNLDEDLDEASDSDGESDYDELPPFKHLTKAQLSNLSKSQKKAYYDEMEYREKLFMKKQLKEEKKRRKFMKKMADSAKDLPRDYTENVEEEESGGAASMPVPMPDLALPASFDSDNPTHRFRCLDSSNQWLVRPVLETNGWDHDVGYEGINVERLFVVKDNIPLSISGQVTKDKKESNLQMELASSIKHGVGKATSLGFDLQTVGKDMAYTLHSETRFCNFRHNKAAAGLSVTLLGDALTAGVKLEDKLIVNKRFRVVMTGGAMTGRGDVAYGGSLEATLKDKDYPLGRTLSTLGLSIMDWHGDLAIGFNLQSQFPIGRSTNMIARANLNNRGAGQVSVRVNSSDQLQIALVALVPLFRKLLSYSQLMQFGQ